jgi:DNA-binding NtrC family response regulator
MDVLREIRRRDADQVVVVITAFSSIESAIEAMREGAFHYIPKPFKNEEVLLTIRKGLEQRRLTLENRSLKEQLRQRFAFDNIIGKSKPMQQVYELIQLAAPSKSNILILGDSGTGKELVARTIHDLSNRRNKPFVAINCAAIPETLIESELFGHERGAFTGATERRLGCFELADAGSLFLDEIVEMDNSTQAKLLRVLQEGTFRRVGGKAEIQVDVRVLAATNRAPADAMAQGQLREDLFYRLNVFQIRLPALRERKEDIPLLVRTFIEEFNRQDNRQMRGLTPEAEKTLDRYGWPGNVRELRNVIQRAVVLGGSGLIGTEHLPDNVLRTTEPARPGPSGPIVPIREMERQLIERALQETHQDKRRAAALLGISLKTLYNKLAKYGIQAVKSARTT